MSLEPAGKLGLPNRGAPGSARELDSKIRHPLFPRLRQHSGSRVKEILRARGQVGLLEMQQEGGVHDWLQGEGEPVFFMVVVPCSSSILPATVWH